MMKPLVAGNWKMNGLNESLIEIKTLETRLGDEPVDIEVMICPPATLLHQAKSHSSAVMIGAQDCHMNEKGAHTGDLSAEMLCEAGAEAIIVGHSERRTDHGESDETVAAKASAAIRAGAIAIICVGETQGEREDGVTQSVVLGQLKGSIPGDVKAEDIVIAYEPVWAIGTGLTPTSSDVKEVHATIRGHLTERFGNAGNEIRILYGGSVKPANADELMSIDNVNGALVGGASLKADDFLGIIAAYRG